MTKACLLYQSSARKKGYDLSVFYVVFRDILRKSNNLDIWFCDLSVGPWNDQSQSRKFCLGMHVVDRSVHGVSSEGFHKTRLRLA